MDPQQPVGVRGRPSLDEELRRLRPDGYQSNDLAGDDHPSSQKLSPPRRNPLQPATTRSGSSPVPSIARGDDGLSRPISAVSMASDARSPETTRVTKFRRRVQIQSDGDDARDAGRGSRPSPLRLPGQLPSGPAIRTPNNLTNASITGTAWMSFSRSNSAHLSQLPPEGLPPLHSAAWFNDLDTVLELLKSTADPFADLIWVNQKLYPRNLNHNPPIEAPGQRPTIARPPEAASLPTATRALKALLRHEYLHHACHPLTIAAAHGNERIVDELLKAMLEAAQTDRIDMVLTWRSPPEELPAGCPWVTPLTAAALGGNGVCVRLLAQAIARRKSLTEDRSTYGCFRFRAVTVAQSADVVQNLFKYGCCHPDTIRYSLCDAARRIAKLDCGCSGRNSQTVAQPAPPQRPQRRPDGGVPEGSGDGSNSPPDSPRSAGQPLDVPRRSDLTAMSSFTTQQSVGGGGGGSFQQAATSLNLDGQPAAAASVETRPSAAVKAAELMLFRARLFHDCLGRPLSKALCELRAETLSAVAALSAMVEHGLQPDRFLSHGEHPNLTSTSLLMVLVREYRAALQAAAGSGGNSTTGGSVGNVLSSIRAMSTTAEPGGAAPGAVSLACSMIAPPSGTDMVSAAREVLSSLVVGLLAHGAVVDDPPREGCRQVGGFHLAQRHGPEAPLHYAFVHGPQELVVLLLQYSGLQPEAHEDLLRAVVGADAAGGGDGEQDRQTARARAFYSRGAQGQQQQQQRGSRGQVPWEGGRSSPLLAFGAKIQSALVEGNLPQWLHSGRFSELMEDLIKCTIATDAYMVTSDLTWLIVELFERCMAHQFDNLPQLRLAHMKRKNEGDDGGGGGMNSAAGPDGSTVITVDPEDGGTSSQASGKVAAAALKQHPWDSASQDDADCLPPAPAGKRAGRRKSVEFRAMHDAEGRGGEGGGEEDAGGSASEGGGDEGVDLEDDASSSSVVSDASGEAVAAAGPPLRRAQRLTATSLLTSEDSITLSIVSSLYRHTADAITGLHQALTEGGGTLDGPLASMAQGAGAAPPAALVTIPNNAAALVDWAALLRLVARIAATTLNPPKTHGSTAGQISVFTTAKAVNQLLYARDWARGEDESGSGPGSSGGDGGGSVFPPSVIDIDLLRAIARRHPHEAARLIHGLDMMRVELKGYRWDSIPMSLDQDFYAVFSKGEAVKISNRAPTVAAASVVAAAEATQRPAEMVSGRAKRKGSASVFPAGSVATSPDGAAAAVAAHGTAEWGLPAVQVEPLTGEDLLQACIFSNMWTVLTHFLLSSTRLPGYMWSLQSLRNRTYKYAVLGQVFQYGSIPVVIGVGVILALLGVLARGLQRAVRLVGNLILAVYGRLEERLQPAMSHVGRKLQLDRVQRKVGRMVRRVDQLAIKATGGNVISGSAAVLTVRSIPHYLSFLGVLLDPDALAEVWLGVTQHYSRGRARKFKSEGVAGGGGGGVSDGGGPAYLSWRTTRVVCNRVPLSCAAAMPSSLLYKLASSPQVNAELFSSPVMRAIITWRWQHYTRYFLLLQFVEHLIYMMFFMVYAFSLSYNQDTFTKLLGEGRTVVMAREGCTLPPSGFQKFLLISIGVMTLTCFVQEFRQLLFFKLGWFRQPWNLMDFASSAIVTTIITLHVDCRTEAVWLRGLAAIEVALLFMRLLYFAMADDRLGSFFRMVIEVLRDCWLFFVFLGILFIGWGLALAVLQGQNTPVQDTYLQLFTMIFGDFSMNLLESADAGSPGLNQLWRMFASVYQIMVTIILLNLLIAIINDSYERINDNETCESLRNKLTLIVEAESVLPQGMARRMLESLAQADLYVITAEAATVSASSGTVEEDNAASNGGPRRGPRRTLPAPARWSGRMGETKRFIGNLVDQLTTQQMNFQTRVLTMLGSMASLKGAGEALPVGPIGLPSAGREGAGKGGTRGGKATAARLSGVGAGGLGGVPAASAATQGSLIDMGDAEAFAEVIELGKLLRDKLSELKQQNEETQQRQEEAMAGMALHLQEAMERVGREVARTAADSAAAAALTSSACRLGGGENPGARGQPGGADSRMASPGGRGGNGGGGLVLVERSVLEGIALRAAEQAAQVAVQAVMRELGRG